jgi:gliding motility-associated lipoprotein GldJ
MKRLIQNIFGIALTGMLVLSSCSKERSSATGWEFNNYKNGGFEKFDAREQETGPGLVMIEGGTFTMGRTEQDVMADWNARAARVTVSSFYIDRTEVTNFHWLEYMYWMRRVYYKTYPHVYKKCLPDTLAWRSALSYKEKYVNYYLRHPSYRDYPVVGVSWLQANDFCKWRTDRVNEAILVREGILKWHFAEEGIFSFIAFFFNYFFYLKVMVLYRFSISASRCLAFSKSFIESAIDSTSGSSSTDSSCTGELLLCLR